MMNLNNRIYSELNEWKYAENLLTEYSLGEKRKLKIVNAFLIIISLAGIAGWFRFDEYKVFWTIILVSAQGTRIMQNVLFTSGEDLFNIKNSISFYSLNIMDLENLYYDFHNSKYQSKTVESKLNKLREKERDLFGKQTFDKIKPNKKLIEIAEIHTDDYLKKIIKNIANES